MSSRLERTADTQTRDVYMLHYYNALFTGDARSFPVELRVRIVAEVAQDLCTLVRTLPKETRLDFLRDVTNQVRPS